MINTLPVVFITHEDLLQLRHSFDTECNTLEHGLSKRRSRPDTVLSLYLESQNEERGSLDEEYRFQERVLAVSRALMEYIEGSIRTNASVFLGSSDFFHFLRVALDMGAASPKILHTLQSHSFVHAVTQHRGMVFQLSQSTEAGPVA